MSNWNSKILSIGGRLTLIKSVLGSLGTYYFSIFKAPMKVLKKLEGFRSNFFWGGSLGEKKIHWVAWDKVLMPFRNNGLGVSSLQASNQALLAKWWWRYRVEPNALWRKIIKSIPGVDGGLNHVGLSRNTAGL